MYDIESNILSWELSKAPISHTLEIGNIIIHVSKVRKPVLIEILNASKFVGKVDKIKLENIKKLTTETN